MIFMESLNNKLNTFINNVDSKILKKFIVGFYQLSNKDIKYSDTLYTELIDTKKLILKVLDYFNGITSIEEEVKKSTPTEDMALFLTYMAHIYASMMKIEMSLPLYLESVKIREYYLDVKSLDTAINYQSIGAVYEQSGEFDYALHYYKKALALRKELSYVENNLLIAESYSRLALVYYHLEKYTISLGYMDKTVKIREKLLSAEHTLLESSYYNYKLILKKSQPKEDYFRLLWRPIYLGIESFIRRLVGQK